MLPCKPSAIVVCGQLTECFAPVLPGAGDTTLPLLAGRPIHQRADAGIQRLALGKLRARSLQIALLERATTLLEQCLGGRRVARRLLG